MVIELSYKNGFNIFIGTLVRAMPCACSFLGIFTRIEQAQGIARTEYRQKIDFKVCIFIRKPNLVITDLK